MAAKTVKSLPEYKALDEIIKRCYSKYELALWHTSGPNIIRPIAVPKYTGLGWCINVYNMKDPAYTFDYYHGLQCSLVKDKFSDIYWYLNGIRTGSHNNYIFYLHNHELFKHNVDFFKELFKTTISLNLYDNDSGQCNFHDINSKTNKLTNEHAFFRVKGGDFETFAVRNMLSV